MTTDERAMAEIAEANPVSEVAPPSPQERAEAEQVLRRVLAQAAAAPPRRPRPRSGLGVLVPIASLLVVVGVAALILRTGGSSAPSSTATGGLQIALTTQPTPQTPRITASAMSREMSLMRRRLASLGHGYVVSQSGAHGITITLPQARAAQRSRVVRLVTTSAQLFFYDWEANVLTPNGKTAAAQLLTQNAGAVTVSQGGNGGAGIAGAGSMSLYAAVTLAAKQPTAPLSRFQSRKGSEYYMFGAPGSAACSAAAAADGTTASRDVHCLLAGPVAEVGTAAGRRQAIDELTAQLPAGVTASEGQLLAIPQGTVVLQAEQPIDATQVPFADPSAQFFVLRDHLALTGNEITHPQATIDQSGEPAVTFGFTGPGRAAFQQVTKTIAHRGATVSLGDTQVSQHFAVALDSQLLTVPQIDFRQYPDGIIGDGGADITGGFTRKSARDLATELRYGALPLAVRVVR